MKKLVLVLGLPVFSLSAIASAHFNLDAPPATSAGIDGGKGVPPCGDNPNPGTATPAQGGHPLTVKIDEFVQHTGFYRFALAISSLSELPVDNVVKDASGKILPPNGMPKGTSASAVYEDPPVFPVLADHMFVHTAAGNAALSFQADIVLPNVNCDSCTLQVIEFMAGHDFNTLASGAPAGGYFYHHCANLKITADPSLPLFTPGAGGSAGGASASGGSAGMPASGGGAGVIGSGGSGGAGVISSGGAGVISSGGAGVISSGGAGVISSGGGGSPSTGGTSIGGISAGGQSSGGAQAGGTAGAGVASAESSSDNAGCSCSLSRRTKSLAYVAPLLGLLLLARRRRTLS